MYFSKLYTFQWYFTLKDYSSDEYGYAIQIHVNAIFFKFNFKTFLFVCIWLLHIGFCVNFIFKTFSVFDKFKNIALYILQIFHYYFLYNLFLAHLIFNRMLTATFVSMSLFYDLFISSLLFWCVQMCCITNLYVLSKLHKVNVKYGNYLYCCLYCL